MKKPGHWSWPGFQLAEREGFEPPLPVGKAVFKTAAFDHSATSPVVTSHDPVVRGAKIASSGRRPRYLHGTMSTRIHFLGAGTSQGVPVVLCTCAVCTSNDGRDKRLRTSAWIHVDGIDLLIDAGPDLRQQALRSGLPGLDAVLLSHEHMDHVAGIDDLRAFNFAQGRAMDIHANAATLAAVQRMFHYAFAAERYPGAPVLRLHAVGSEPFHIGSVQVRPIRVQHGNMEVLGYRLGDLAYLTDVKSIDHTERAKLKGLDVLVVNALRLTPHHSHISLSEAMALVHELAPARAYFTHISHLLGKHAEVQKDLPNGMFLAYDGLVVDTIG